MGAPLSSIQICIFGFLRMSRKKDFDDPLSKGGSFPGKWIRPFLHSCKCMGLKKILSDITMKPLVVITHNKTRKFVLPIFCNSSVNMQMRHYHIPDVLQIMLNLST